MVGVWKDFCCSVVWYFSSIFCFFGGGFVIMLFLV